MKGLTLVDVLEMLKDGPSPDIVIAKIRGSACEFDTAPATLKALKAASAPGRGHPGDGSGGVVKIASW